jgi:hypothetical protein
MEIKNQEPIKKPNQWRLGFSFLDNILDSII